MTTEPYDHFPAEEPPRLSPQEITHRKVAGVDLPDDPIPFHTAGPAWTSAPLPPMFGVPHCGECGYYHHKDEEHRR